MTLIVDNGRSGGLLRILAPFGHALARLGAMVQAELDRRRTAALLELDDHQLADMGITRSDVASAIAAPLAAGKPSERLCRERADRRYASRKAARSRLDP